MLFYQFACFLLIEVKKHQSICMVCVDQIASFASLGCMINLDHFACVSLIRLHGFDRMSLKKMEIF